MTDLLSAAQLVALEPIMDTLLDAADAYDMDNLTFVAGCGIHGARPESNVECTCTGTRYSAVEFIHALALNVKTAKDRSVIRELTKEHQQATMRLRAV